MGESKPRSRGDDSIFSLPCRRLGSPSPVCAASARRRRAVRGTRAGPRARGAPHRIAAPLGPEHRPGPPIAPRQRAAGSASRDERRRRRRACRRRVARAPRAGGRDVLGPERARRWRGRGSPRWARPRPARPRATTITAARTTTTSRAATPTSTAATARAETSRSRGRRGRPVIGARPPRRLGETGLHARTSAALLSLRRARAIRAPGRARAARELRARPARVGIPEHIRAGSATPRPVKENGGDATSASVSLEYRLYWTVGGLRRPVENEEIPAGWRATSAATETWPSSDHGGAGRRGGAATPCGHQRRRHQ